MSPKSFPTENRIKRAVIGQSPSGIAYHIAREVLEFPERREPILLLAPNSKIAEEIQAGLRFFLAERGNQSSLPEVLSLSGWEVLPFDGLSPTSAVTAARILCLYKLWTKQPVVVVLTPAVFMQKLPRPDRFFAHSVELRVGEKVDRDALLQSLDILGYVRSTLVEELGQLAVRGAVLDLFPPGIPFPARVELFGEHIESIRLFDPESQRSTAEREELTVLPIRELCLPWEGLPTPEGDRLRQETKLRLRDRASDLQISMRRVGLLEEALDTGFLLPGMEHLQALFDPELVTLWDYCPERHRIFAVNEAGVLSEFDATESLVHEQASRATEEGRIFPKPHSAFELGEALPRQILSEVELSFEQVHVMHDGQAAEVETRKVFSVSAVRDAVRARRWAEKPFLPLVEEVRKRVSEGLRPGIVLQQMSRAPRVEELLASYDLAVIYPGPTFADWRKEIESEALRANPAVTLLQGYLPEGIVAKDDGFLLFSEADLFGEVTRNVTTTTGKSVRRFVASALQLQENDFIVHIEHGVGIYRGLKTIEVDGKLGDFLQLEYSEGAKLFLPVENLAKIQKYSSADSKKPALSKLGGKSWQATKGKIRTQVVELAGQLVQLFAQREIVEGERYGAEDDDDRTFADTFPYEETPDQRQAIQDVLADLDLGKPMDRLICGDVGYGKTEVAIRGAFKVANSGKQVAVLAPTTVLVDQHYQTFQRRFEDTPFRIGVLSRFQTPQENRETLARVMRGEIDIVIGTHRLLQRDVAFKDLGLIVIDEEHRFGVAHKEKLKRLRSEVHVITLTATPIPRTLHMSMVGIRDLSVIETAPVNRQIIRTHVSTYSDSIIREAIMRELSRSGQIFFIHNRVDNIATVAAHLAELVPEARVGFGHGQMKDSELEKVMHRFVQHEIDILVSTTIVESGLDIPNANTIIIRSADKFGLAELYQLRGRVGRSSRRAYAYLLVPDPQTLSVDAQKRLQVLQSLDDLGIGFRLAIQDLEIRGAGNLLGQDQSGHIHSIGFELYSRILKEAIEEQRALLRREKPDKRRKVPDVDPEMKVGFPAHIPSFYIPDVAERLLLYQRLIGISTEDEGHAMVEEIEDRFGRPPAEVLLLVHLMMLRGALRQCGITAVTLRKNVLFVSFHPELAFSGERVKSVIEKYHRRLRLTPAQSFVLTLAEEEVETPKDLIPPIRELAKALGIATI